MKFSIIIINYNYARFLKKCIFSVISQKYENKEIIIVDDGSIDDSRKVIESFDDSIIKLYQTNKGMMEAANAGFAVSSGDIIIFVDADDYLLDNALETIISNWEEGLSKIHFRLRTLDANDNKIGCFPPMKLKLSDGEVWKEIINTGTYVSTPTTGNAFSRKVLEKFFPITDAKIGEGDTYLDSIPTDAYLKYKVPFYGPVKAIQNPLGSYRIHGNNSGASKSPYENNKKRLRKLILAKNDLEFIQRNIQDKGISIDKNLFFKKNKFLKMRMLSLRFDKKNYPWADDNIFDLLKISFKNILESNNTLSTLRNMYDHIIIALLAVLPQKQAYQLLRFVHKKYYSH